VISNCGTQQGNSDAFKKYSQMKFGMKREALAQLNRPANKLAIGEAQTAPVYRGLGTALIQR
jgi:hypothetical protein